MRRQRQRRQKMKAALMQTCCLGTSHRPGSQEHQLRHQALVRLRQKEVRMHLPGLSSTVRRNFGTTSRRRRALVRFRCLRPILICFLRQARPANLRLPEIRSKWISSASSKRGEGSSLLRRHSSTNSNSLTFSSLRRPLHRAGPTLGRLLGVRIHSRLRPLVLPALPLHPLRTRRRQRLLLARGERS